MKITILLATILTLAASVKAGSMNDLESASAAISADKGCITVPQASAPVEIKDEKDAHSKGFIDDILDQIPFKRTYRLGPLFKMEADSALPAVVRNFENAEAKVQESRVEGGWRDSYVVVVYKAGFRAKQYRRDGIQGVLSVYLKKDQIISELQRQGVHVIYGRVEGLPGDFSIIIDYAGGKADVPQIADGILGKSTEQAGH
jgi:hypothetical protein